MARTKTHAKIDGPSRSERLIHEAAFATATGLALFLLVALLSYHPADPGWSSSGGGGQVHNLIGVIGAWIADVCLSLFGFVAYALPWLIMWLGINTYRGFRASEKRPSGSTLLRLVAAIIAVVCCAALFALHIGSSENAVPQGSGGIIGLSLGHFLVTVISDVGASLVLITLVIAALPLALMFSWLTVFDRVGSFLQNSWTRFSCWREERARIAEEKAEAAKPRFTHSPNVAPTLNRTVPPSVEQKQPAKRKEIKKIAAQEVQYSLPIDQGDDDGEAVPEYAGIPLPFLNQILDPPKPPGKGFDNEDLERISTALEENLKHFGVQVEVVDAQPGPVVTRFEVQPAPGVKGAQISNLSRDLARALSVASVRVIEVVDGKSVIGLEIPNQNRDIVSLSEILAGSAYQNGSSPLTLALGKDIAGHPAVIDLAKMPHLMVAGTTGSGKSVAINVMILSILFKATAAQVKLILIDPKMLELSVYDGIPHLLTPVVTDMKDAANALRWCVAEMERRYKLMSHLGVRNLAGLNKKVAEARVTGKPIHDPFAPKPEPGLFVDEETTPEPVELEHMPNIVVVIDELADMMMVVGKKVEELIARIAQKARAAGIHLIVATQRPSVDVITGLIKANIPSRIAFQVASRIDSRTILDDSGAETLLGHGDMLYRPVGSSRISRFHGAFVDDHEVHRLVKYLKQAGEPRYLDAIVSGEPDPSTVAEGDSDAEKDELYDQAVAVVLESGKASISWVQRRLKIGYNRAARMVEQMEAAGIISESGPGGAREILVPTNQD